MSSKAMLSEEKVQDSSDEDSEVEETPKLQSSKIKLGSKSKQSTANRLSSTESEDSSDESDGSDSSSQSSSSSSSRGSKRKATQIPEKAAESLSKRAKTTSAGTLSNNKNIKPHDIANVKRVESSKYVPPHGFTANKMQPSELSAQSQALFEDLGSKQVWHISAPSSFPVSKLESLDVQAALKGESILQHKGMNYTMAREDVGAAALLTPKPNGDYVHTAPVSRAFKIIATASPLKQPGNETNGDKGASRYDTATAPTKPTTFFATKPGQTKIPRKQPENLKARYVPYGVVGKPPRDEDEGNASDQDVTMTDVPSTGPNTLAKPSSEVQVEATPKSSKKSKTKKASSSQVEVNESPSKRRKEKHVASSQGEPESSQKKKKRKERGSETA